MLVCRGQHVALDFVRGVVHMHSRHIIHLDLKSANLLLSRDGTAKIADVRPLSPVKIRALGCRDQTLGESA